MIPDLGKDGGHVDGIPFDFSTLDVDDKARPHWEDFTNSRALVEVPLRAKER